MRQRGVEDLVCVVPSLHLRYGSETGAEEPRVAWFDRARGANRALPGTAAGGGDKVLQVEVTRWSLCCCMVDSSDLALSG